LRRNLTVEAVAREVARRQGISVAHMITLGQERVGSLGRVLTAWVGREVGGISIARTAKYFRRDTSTMARNVSRLEERMRAAKDLRSLCNRLVENLGVRQSTSVRDPPAPSGDGIS
jgi:chromosomal replication initiation ATPase DnaA